MAELSSHHKFLKVLIARASIISGELSMDSMIYRKVGLLQAKINAIKSQDILEDLTDIDYLSKLESKLKKLTRELAQKELMPAIPTELLNADFSILQDVVTFFDSSDWVKGKEKFQKIQNTLLSASEPLGKSDLNDFLEEISNFKGLLRDKCEKFKNLNKNDFWVDRASIDPALVEYSILQLGKPISNPQLGSELYQILGGVEKFEANLLNQIEELKKKTNDLLVEWNNLKTKEPTLCTLLSEGKLEELQSALIEANRFTDLNLNTRVSIDLYLDIKEKGQNLTIECEKFLKNAENAKTWAANNEDLSKGFSQTLNSFEELLSPLGSDIIDVLRSNLDFSKWKDLCEKAKNEVLKSKNFINSQNKAKKTKKFLIILSIFALSSWLFYTFEKEYQEKKLLQLQSVADAFGVTIEEYQSALQSYTLPSDYTGWWVHLEKGLTPDEDIPWGIFEIKNSQKNGRFTKFFFDKLQKAETGFYEDNKLHGEFKKWRVDGIISEEGTYKNGEKVGEWKYFFSNDKSKTQIHRSTEEVNSYEKELFGLDETQFKNALRSDSQPSKLNGWWIQTKDGQSLAIYEMSGAVKNGRYALLHKDPDESGFRKKKEEGEFMLGYKNGKTTSFYKNGMISSSGFYRMGEKVGGWVFTSENGEETIKQFGKLPSDFIKVNEKLLKPLTSLNLDNEESLNEIKLGLNKVSLEFEFVHKQGFFKSKKKEIFSTESFLLQDKKFIFTLVHSLDGPFQIDGKLKSIESVKARIKGSDLKEEIIIKEVAFMDDGRILIIPLPLSLTDSVIQNSQIKIFEFSDISSKEKCFIIDKNNEANLLHLSKDPNDSRYLKIDSEVDLPKGAHIFSKERKMVGIVLNRSFAFSIANLGGRIKSGSRILMNNAFNKLDTENLIFELESLYKTLDSRFQ